MNAATGTHITFTECAKTLEDLSLSQLRKRLSNSYAWEAGDYYDSDGQSIESIDIGDIDTLWEVFDKRLTSHPHEASEQDVNQNYPLHLALRMSAPTTVLRHLIDINPGAASAFDYEYTVEREDLNLHTILLLAKTVKQNLTAVIKTTR